MEDRDLWPIHIDHIGIAANSLDEGSHFWRLLGLIEGEEDEINIEQGVKIRFFSTAHEAEGKVPRLEILEPTGEQTPIADFIAKRGVGIQQLCLRVPDLRAMLEHLSSNGIQLIDENPRRGSDGNLIAFVHPRSPGGALVELCQTN
jgi:methylmalonyl-CoA epimerase